MNFFKLEKKEYKKCEKKFRNTYVGGKLYLIYDLFLNLGLVTLILSSGFDFLYKDETNDILNVLDSGLGYIGAILLFVGSMIIFCFYYKNLKEYVENELKEEDIIENKK